VKDTPNPNYISISLWGVLRGPTLCGLLRLPQAGKEPGQLLGSKRQRVPAPRVTLRQRVAQSSIPSELLPRDQFVDGNVQWDAAQDVDRLALLGVDQPQPVNGLEHLGLTALLDDCLDAGIGMD